MENRILMATAKKDPALRALACTHDKLTRRLTLYPPDTAPEDVLAETCLGQLGQRMG
ncbi:hypothetical protein [Ruegeria sp. HKCCSP346]|uniref:hypothetical protein n=1 Tax=Ruegeria sp. HKCCSP346 TaxID=2794830 RepID=UPI001AE9338F|nr:hypothetical protein [Ruegeria sp. HKCCSP346]